MRAIFAIIAGLIVLVTITVRTCCYIVDEREQAVVVQFGDPVVTHTDPGLYFRIPFVQTVRYLPKTRQFFGGAGNDLLPDLPTKDGKKVEVTPWAIWRITDPIAFVKVLREMENAKKRVEQFTRNAVRDVITQHDLIELVRSTNRELTYTFAIDLAGEAAEDAEAPDLAIEQPKEVKATIKMGRPKILEQIKNEARMRLSSGKEEATEEAGRGIEIVDVGVSRIDFVESVRRAAFDRLRKFMESIAAYYTNDGERQKQAILNRTRAEVQRIEGEGKQQANETRGKVDAEIIRRYSKAIRETGDFYVFSRTLEVLETSASGDTRLILTTDSDLLSILKALPAATAPVPETATSP